MRQMLLTVLILVSFQVQWVIGGILYNRSELNETRYPGDRYVVYDFIDPHRMKLFNRLLRPRSDDVYDQIPKDYNTYYKLKNINMFNIDANHPELRHILSEEERCVDGKTFPPQSSCADFYLKVFKDPAVLAKINVTKYASWLEEIQNYVHIRNKIFEYASEVFNTTVGPSDIHDGTTIYHFKAHADVVDIINNRRYMFPPHCDAVAIDPTYSRPLKYQPHQYRPYELAYTKYTALVFLNTIPAKDLGALHLFDFPNHDKLPHEKSRILPSLKNSTARVIHSPMFADPDFKIHSIQPVAGTLVVFNGEDVVHAIQEYIGDVNRRSITFNLADADNYFRMNNHMRPSWNVKDKAGPNLNYV